MVDYDKLYNQLTLHEKNEEFPYIDTMGKITIGIGHNLTEDGLSSNVRDMIFSEDVTNHWSDLITNYRIVETLDEVRQRVLLDMCFNMGIDKLSKFNDMWDAIERRDWTGARNAMIDSKWAKQVKMRAFRLARMMESGIDYVNQGI